MQEQKQPTKINISLPDENDDIQKYLFRVEKGLIEDIVKKVLEAKVSIEKSEDKHNVHTPSATIKALLLTVFGMAGIGLLILAVTQCIPQWFNLTQFSLSNRILFCIMTLALIFFGIISCLIAWDVWKETDKNYLISLFAAIVALCSLGVSIISYSIQTKPDTRAQPSSSAESSDAYNP